MRFSIEYLANMYMYIISYFRYFYLYQVLSRWEEYISKVGHLDNEKVEKEKLDDLFPFHVFFSNAPKPLFKVVIVHSVLYAVSNLSFLRALISRL